MEYFTELGYIGLFVASFLSATILPLSSVVVLIALLVNGFSPVLSVTIATVGNVLGAVVNYILGFWLNMNVLKRWLKMSDEDFANAERRFQKYGLASLCLAWVPVIGDPLTVIAGMLRVNIAWFLVLVTLGKLLRYAVLAYLTLQAF